MPSFPRVCFASTSLYRRSPPTTGCDHCACPKHPLSQKQVCIFEPSSCTHTGAEEASSDTAARCLGVAGAATAAALVGEEAVAAAAAVVCVDASLGGCSARSRSPSTAFLSFTCRLRFSSCRANTKAAVSHFTMLRAELLLIRLSQHDNNIAKINGLLKQVRKEDRS